MEAERMEDVPNKNTTEEAQIDKMNVNGLEDAGYNGDEGEDDPSLERVTATTMQVYQS